MAPVNDPFATPSGESPAEDGDPFASPGGGGNYPKPDELNGELLLFLISDMDVQKVPDRFNKGQGLVDRLQVDTTVLTGELAGETFDQMYWSQKPIVAMAKRAHKKGTKAVLGRLRRFPVSEDKGEKDGPQTWQDVEALFEDFENRKIKKAPRFAWALEDFSPEDADIARKYLAANPIR